MHQEHRFGNISRRAFVKSAACVGAACMAGRSFGEILPTPELREASFWEPIKGGKVQCGLCPWNCVVPEGKRGRCGVRENRNGRYYSLVYGRVRSWNNDPIEKKPFFHVLPGCTAFSIATVGCNLTCKFCQNWDISQASPDDEPTPFRTPDQIVQMAQAERVTPRVIAYTYNEPTIYTEYVIDCAKAAKDAGLGNVTVSNGFIADQAARKLYPLLTAVKIDLKAFTQKFYQEICSGQLQPVLDTLLRLKDCGVWFEIVVLTIPTLNDKAEDIKRMSGWILRELGPNVPLHFTRFHSAYRLKNLPATPLSTLQAARKTAMDEGCNFVYAGNAPGQEGENTYCPKCKAAVVSRYGFTSKTDGLKDGKCVKCGETIPGVWT